MIRLSRLGKIAASVAGIGGILAIYGRLEGVAWAAVVGTVLLFGGVLVYFVERLRMFGKKS